ncbi:MAG: citrate/2-methylcitrate synthase [Candidatus Kaelpia aquatica]|nr:citrate/2-methylcitrate synthase [Candidatus Kaelpia aquatica]
MSSKEIKDIKNLILDAKKEARKSNEKDIKPAFTGPISWPVDCTVGPGLEGAIACESAIGYVNGAQGELIYRGYDVFDLCAYSTFEEVSYLLLYGNLPTKSELNKFKKDLLASRSIPQTIRLMMGFPVKDINTMAALRIGTNFMRHERTFIDRAEYCPDIETTISSDEDSIPMETYPTGEKHAIYEFKNKIIKKPKEVDENLHGPMAEKAYIDLIAGVSSVVGAVSRFRADSFPVNPDPELSHAGNLIYMITGRKPDPVEERIMDIVLILHADHGMNASTFATMVVASTLSDIYFAVGSGIAALNGPLHGGANEQVLNTLNEIGSSSNVDSWYQNAREKKMKIVGFGHRVYKAYDPRARVLGPLAEYLIKSRGDRDAKNLFAIARKLEKKVISTLGKDKGVFPNVDFYSGLVYSALGISKALFTPIFAASRVSGWTARVREYHARNRIFRPRAVYSGEFDRKYIPIERR